jgi:hypothetical protein
MVGVAGITLTVAVFLILLYLLVCDDQAVEDVFFFVHLATFEAVIGFICPVHKRTA